MNPALWGREVNFGMISKVVESVKLSKLIDPIEEVSNSCIHVGKSRFCTSRSEWCYSGQMPSIPNLTLKWSTWITMTGSFATNLGSCTQVPLSDSNLELGKVSSVTFTVIVHLDLNLLQDVWSSFICNENVISWTLKLIIQKLISQEKPIRLEKRSNSYCNQPFPSRLQRTVCHWSQRMNHLACKWGKHNLMSRLDLLTWGVPCHCHILDTMGNERHVKLCMFFPRIQLIFGYVHPHALPRIELEEGRKRDWNGTILETNN